MRPPALIALLAFSAGLPAQAEVRRCALPDGTTVYTDRRCDAIGGQPRAMPADTVQLRSHRAACARTLRDLAYEVRAAVDSQDVNRLAGVYLWSGIGTRQGYALMDRLKVIVDRPLVDLQPVYSDTGADPYYPTTVTLRPPVGLRLEQTSIRGGTPLQAVFGLRKHLGCWWIVEGGTRRATAPAAEAPPEPSPPPVD
ncbi:MAG TPA: hypothetical protein VIG88_13375 [Lysobacter sp.]